MGLLVRCHDAFLARESCPPSSSIRLQVLHAKGLWGCIIAASYVLCLYAKQLQLKRKESVALQDPGSGAQCCIGLLYFKDRCFLHWFRQGIVLCDLCSQFRLRLQPAYLHNGKGGTIYPPGLMLACTSSLRSPPPNNLQWESKPLLVCSGNPLSTSPA